MKPVEFVVLCKLRSRHALPDGVQVGRTVQGLLISLPVPGRQMVILADHSRTTTSPVRRILRDGDVMYVETDNSVYRLSLESTPSVSTNAGDVEERRAP